MIGQQKSAFWGLCQIWTKNAKNGKGEKMTNIGGNEGRKKERKDPRNRGRKETKEKGEGKEKVRGKFNETMGKGRLSAGEYIKGNKSN